MIFVHHLPTIVSTIQCFMPAKFYVLLFMPFKFKFSSMQSTLIVYTIIRQYIGHQCLCYWSQRRSKCVVNLRHSEWYHSHLCLVAWLYYWCLLTIWQYERSEVGADLPLDWEECVYYIVKNDTRRIIVKCSNKKTTSSAWRIHASRLANTTRFAINNFNPVHTCGDMGTDGHKRASRKWVWTIL